MNRRFASLIAVVAPLATQAFCSTTVAAQVAASGADPFIWLEEVEGKRAMDWVHAKNAATEAVLTKTPLYQPIYDRTMKILNSKDRIAFPNIIGDKIYNYWQDAEHQRGYWRRTSWPSYLSGNPVWESVLDVDALSKAENVTWAFAGATCLEPAERYCLISLSRGGSDAAELREFDMTTKQWVKNGIRIPEAKSQVAWLDANTLLLGTNFDAKSMTSSGYPRVIKRWKRGTPLSSAETVLEVDENHVAAFTQTFDAGGRTYTQITDAKTFYTSQQYLYTNGKTQKLETPEDADTYLVRDQIIVYVRDPWKAGTTTWTTGALIAMPVADFLAGKRDFKLVMQPGARETINGISPTKDALIINVLNNVRGELRRFEMKNGTWTFTKIPAPDLGSITVSTTSTKTNRFFFTYTNFIQPTTLYLSNEAGKVSEVKRLPAMFDAKGLAVEQLQATSKDGTKIPFFVVQRAGAPRDGSHPTLLNAYGGFEISSTPAYSSTIGSAWLERGGVFVLANIRGGGEFGPAWHRAGLKENRQRVYDDFAAVSEELIRQKITSPERLGIMGGSNGGLLMGVAITQRPELYNAAVVQVPLLDMRRYNQLLAGASWMAEYGNPDKPEEWEYISKYSPYQNLKEGKKYPTVLFTTTTRDDRVHPGHARKMAALMESKGIPFYYFENTEGGHGNGVTNEQRAKTLAITYSYLWMQLQGKVTP